MTTEQEAYRQMVALFRTAWLADSASLSVPIVYDNDAATSKPEGEDANGRALPWCRPSAVELIEEQETLGGSGQRRFKGEGIFTVEIYTPSGDGYKFGGELARIAKLAFRGNQTTGAVWFPRVTSQKKGQDGPWCRIDVIAEYVREDRG